MVSSEAILDAISARTQTRDSELEYRGRLLADENVAHSMHGAQVLQGEMRSYLLNGDVLNYDMERGYTRHTITESPEQGILIKLGTQCIINSVKMLLWDRDMRSYSYYIEVCTCRNVTLNNVQCNVEPTFHPIILPSVKGIHGSEGLGQVSRLFGLFLPQLAISIFRTKSSSLYTYRRNK